MKKTLLILFALACTVPFAAAQGSVSYSLPKTTLELKVQAERETFHAGPFAAYSAKYLGIKAKRQSFTTFTVTSISMKTVVEADQSQRYSTVLTKPAESMLLQLTTQGLVSGESGAYASESGWKYPSGSEASFEYRGMPANLTSTTNTLYGTDNSAVRQQVVVEKTDEAKAAEVASRIFEIRENKYKILVGDTDATYSGEAMKSAIDALDRMESDYMTLFLGYTDKDIQEASFDVIPDSSNGSQLYIAFRISDTEGLTGPDNFAGKPYYLQLAPEKIQPAPVDPKAKKSSLAIRYRIPAICDVSLGDGVESLLQVRVPVYQLGVVEEYPISK